METTTFTVEHYTKKEVSFCHFCIDDSSSIIHTHGAWWKYTKASSCACVDEGLQSYAFAAGEACHRWHARRINWMRTNVRRRKLGRQGNDGFK